MSKVTVSAKGQVVIPVELRKRLGITPGCQLEFFEEDGAIKVVVRRQRTPTRHADGFGMFVARGSSRRLADFDVAEAMRRSGRR